MKPFESAANASNTPPPPTRCPACESSSILTTSKSPDVESYWRCTKCGEVWNASRSRDNNAYGNGRRWR